MDCALTNLQNRLYYRKNLFLYHNLSTNKFHLDYLMSCHKYHVTLYKRPLRSVAPQDYSLRKSSRVS